MSGLKVVARTEDLSFRTAIFKELQELRSERVDTVVHGVSPEDYRYWVGYLRAVDDILSIAEDIRKRGLER